jgi:hypothetical protein
MVFSNEIFNDVFFVTKTLYAEVNILNINDAVVFTNYKAFFDTCTKSDCFDHYFSVWNLTQNTVGTVVFKNIPQVPGSIEEQFFNCFVNSRFNKKINILVKNLKPVTLHPKDECSNFIITTSVIIAANQDLNLKQMFVTCDSQNKEIVNYVVEYNNEDFLIRNIKKSIALSFSFRENFMLAKKTENFPQSNHQTIDVGNGMKVANTYFHKTDGEKKFDQLCDFMVESSITTAETEITTLAFLDDLITIYGTYTMIKINVTTGTQNQKQNRVLLKIYDKQSSIATEELIATVKLQDPWLTRLAYSSIFNNLVLNVKNQIENCK